MPINEHETWRRTAKYKKSRKEYMDSNPNCEMCLANGIKEPSIELDHIRPPLRGGAKYSHANFQALCRPCHYAKTSSERLRRRKHTSESYNVDERRWDYYSFTETTDDQFADLIASLQTAKVELDLASSSGSMVMDEDFEHRLNSIREEVNNMIVESVVAHRIYDFNYD